ncbi:AraC family ligand binding domain-containing protein [Cronbergia sp. UHCC 0137]|uniref:AraC family ligand binding domain-containing protein n=1 Tax=Cronbergia sp. UHCC 0137 TaxID=3110239 RepID=UPI002B1F71D2|nr:AraC family ligand binding domain-containing protein [Cronbergia sp. UHCC 0137]MEA5620852.1 AraC family ligand binding domain-containing protein [Cronbergia sp. UHCC 0137]
MQNKDWFVTENGQHQACKSARTWDLLRDNYRLYRFLTEVEDVLNDVENESNYLPKIRILVRRLIVNSYWVQSQFAEPDPKTGTSVLLLYNELGFPLTVQTVTFAPGTISNIHNHGTWGIVAVLKGQEKHTFWRRNSHPDLPDKIETTGEINLFPGDIISFTPDTIHQVEAVSNEPTVTFNIYGETDPKRRFEFDVVNHIAKKF